MPDPFVHLHVASGYSLRYGASHPQVLVARAAEHGMSALALTDRDGLYGAVKFVKAAVAAGIRPLIGVDLALESVLDTDPRVNRPAAAPSGRANPARGGGFGDHDRPRVTVLAQGRAGWAALCRLVSATHLRGERGLPVATLDLIAEQVEASAGHLIVLLGPGSELGRALARRRPDQALAHLRRWQEIVAAGDLQIEVVHHRGRGELAQAARLAGFAETSGVAAVITNAVRYADRRDAPTADVLDAARRLVALDPRHVDRVNAEGYLKAGKEMVEIAEEVARAAGLAGDRDGRLLCARTSVIAERSALDPADLGIGEVHFPELELRGRWAGGADPELRGEGEADALLRQRCLAGLVRRGIRETVEVRVRLDEELGVIRDLGYPTYFHTVADVVDLIRDLGVRAAARGSGAGSYVAYLLGISGVDPLEHGLLMERFLSPLRRELPDIDVDVEAARRLEVYDAILDRYGGERCVCVSMMDTYRVRHAIRDVGAALGMPPGEIDTVAKAFPHIAARHARAALADLPELRASGITEASLGLLLQLVERLDGLPRHVALHPCGVLLSDRTLLDRTPVEASWLGYPMSQFDKHDVEELGLLKLDVLGIRMQSAMAHAVLEVARVDGVPAPELDAIPRDDPATFALIQSTKTLGCFQIESPGQRELLGKFAPETFGDLIIDISLFRPGPVKSDMIRPFLEARQGWREPSYLHPDLVPALGETYGVVVFHEQILRMISTFSGCSLAEADETRRALGDPLRTEELRRWFHLAALGKGYPIAVVSAVWEVLAAFASFGFCKAHAAAFALPTYQSAWLKAHHPAAFLAGVLTHDPGMYPKRLILDDARQLGIAILSLDVNTSTDVYQVERVGVFDEPPPEILDQVGGGLDRPAGTGPQGAPARVGPRAAPPLGLPDGRRYGIRLSLAEVKGISAAEVARVVAGRPYASLSDFWHRSAVSRPVVERLVVAGAFDALYGLGSSLPGRRRGQVTRRDLLLQVAELDQWSRAMRRAVPRGVPRTAARVLAEQGPVGVRERAARQSQGPAPVEPGPVQLALDLDGGGGAPSAVRPSGLPEMSGAQRVQAELDVLGLDASSHVLASYEPFFAGVGITRSRDLLGCRNQREVLVAGVKVATQTPPIRSGRRVIFVTLDDATGPVDATFFEDAQVGYAATVFHNWLLVIRGVIRRTGPRGISLRALGCWELPVLHAAWVNGGLPAVRTVIDTPPVGFLTPDLATGLAGDPAPSPIGTQTPVRVYATGYHLSPYADLAPPGPDTRTSRGSAAAPRRLWHSSPGSAGG